MLKKIAICLDKLANFKLGGDIEATISARTGYHARNNESSVYWILIRLIIDAVFNPVDDNHCIRAFEFNPSADFQDAAFFQRLLLLIGVVLVCTVLFLPFLVAGAFGVRF